MPKLKLKKQFGSIQDSKEIGFEITGLDNPHGIRISFENATNTVKVVLKSSKDNTINLPANINSYEGWFDLNIPEHSSHAAISIFATIESIEDDKYNIVDIISSVYHIVIEKSDYDGNIYIDPSFVGPKDKCKIEIKHKPKDNIVISVNDKHLKIKTNEEGYGSTSFVAEDVITNQNVTVMQKFPVNILIADNKEIFSGSYIHILPSKVAMFVDCEAVELPPECIMEEEVETPTRIVVPDGTTNFPITDLIQEPFSKNVTGEGDTCKTKSVANLNNVGDHSVTILPNGMAVVAVVDIKSDFSGHSISLIGDTTSLLQRTFSGVRYGIVPFTTEPGEIHLYVSEDIFDAARLGMNVALLSEQFLYKQFNIIRKESLDAYTGFNTLVLSTTLIGNLPETSLCVPFLLVEDASCTPSLSANLIALIEPPDGNSLSKVSVACNPNYIGDNNSVYVYIVVQSMKDGLSQLFFTTRRIPMGSSCTAVSGSVESIGWYQLTFYGENRNPQTKVDTVGNLHVFWESDRSGLTQLYHGCLGPGSISYINADIAAGIDKHAELMLSKIKPFSHTLLPIISDLGTPGSIGLSQWLEYAGGAGRIDVPNSTEIHVQAVATDDFSMAFTSIDRDTNDTDVIKEGLYKHLNFQISFNLSDNLSISSLDDLDIDDLFADWQSQFVPLIADTFNDTVYELRNNRYALSIQKNIYDHFIPLVGSYKNSQVEVELDQGNTTTADSFRMVLSGTRANVRHFVIGLMPEKTIFRASNVETAQEFCDRLELPLETCGDNYEFEQEQINYTGRYKLIILMNANNDYFGSPLDKDYGIVREVGGPFSLDKEVHFNILAHYSKMLREDIDSWLGEGNALENRFISSLIIELNEEFVFGESFLVDLDSNHRTFEIGFGIPDGGSFSTGEFLPNETTIYDNKAVDFVFTNIVVGSPTVTWNERIIDVPKDYADFNTVISGEGNSLSETESFLDNHDLFTLGVDISGFPQVPITFSGMNKSVSVALGPICNDIHLSWESNRNMFWDIFTSNNINRGLAFRHDTRITNTKSNSLMPSIAVNNKGHRIIAWHDNRDKLFQIYGARSFESNRACTLDDCAEMKQKLITDKNPDLCTISFSFCADPCTPVFENPDTDADVGEVTLL